MRTEGVYAPRSSPKHLRQGFNFVFLQVSWSFLEPAAAEDQLPSASMFSAQTEQRHPIQAGQEGRVGQERFCIPEGLRHFRSDGKFSGLPRSDLVFVCIQEKH